ncbi:MAG TPA: TM0106 family RecB-like putative nuclease, partial [Longimicrobiales bacterium]|nr:TM0106 family RecB-like putative nuclease [Longimicrobiales bacterium]
MHLAGSALVVSATDLSGYLACRHYTSQDLAVQFDGADKPPDYPDPGREVLQKRGQEHEARILAGYRARGLGIAEPRQPTWEEGVAGGWASCAAETLEMMRDGADVVYQACLFDGRWLGRPDFLVRVERPSALGDWSYEVVDAKLSREAKAGAVLQICFYSEMLEAAQGVGPERMHLALGGPRGVDCAQGEEARSAPDATDPMSLGPPVPLESLRVADFAAYYRSVKRRLLDHIGERPATYPEPCTHCTICKWSRVCDRRWREDDHLSLVAGITRKQRAALGARGTTTLEALAGMPLALPRGERLDGVSPPAYAKIREQARIQLEGRREQRHLYELFTDVSEGHGLARLPQPSPGDLFFDIEGDPHALDEGLEYLFGVCDSSMRYTCAWALDRAEEKSTFEGFIDGLMARLEEHPDLHVYHFGHYEPTALKRLMGRHATREEEVDRLLRGGVLVDLHRVVVQSLRASVESYSIKKLEPLYRFEREVNLRAASSALAHFEAWLALGTGERKEGDLLTLIQRYNEDDCVSTVKLREWLEDRRTELARMTGTEVPRPAALEPAPEESQQEELDRVAALVERLTEGVPAAREDRSDEDQARWLLAHLLGFHRREDKSVWWQYFAWLDGTVEELTEDRKTLTGLQYQGVVDTVKRSYVHRYRFPKQEHGFEVGDSPLDPVTEKARRLDKDAKAPSPGEVWAVDDVRGFIDLKRGIQNDAPHPSSLIPDEYVNPGILRASLIR